ncbi:zinc finger protein 182-like [Leguminivora glycinivorella]|uniref:zinc finger protein 182-like n=1 Tax=Leguminivora glycinivorella TaxID=1035111 RepID=UPI00200D4346|nr:zinc finger protein 182-like [Leguminivora glycinivorella]
MDFVKREDQAIIDDELQQHYKLYMENAQKTHMEPDYQHALSMEQLHQIQTSINSTIAHNFQLPLSPRQISSLMLKTNHFNQIPAHLPRNLELDLAQNLNDLTQMRNEDINQNLRLNELELQAAQNLQLNEQELSRLNQDLRLELPQNLGRDMELGHELMSHMDERRMDAMMETRMVLEEPRQVDHHHQIPQPFHIKLEQDEEYFYENVNQISQAINVNGMSGHIPVHTEHPQQAIHQDQMYAVYNNHITAVPALNSLDLYQRPQNYVQYVTNVRDNPENLVVHRQFENASPYAEEFKKLAQDVPKKMEEPKENQKPNRKIPFSNFQDDFVPEKNENDASAQNKMTEELSMNIKGEYSCYKCNDVFSTKRGLKQHAKTCTEANDPMEKLGKFVCSQCPYRCQSPAILKIHERTHTGEKPFSCTFCDYKSGQKNNVAKHILVHMKEKPFRCQYCEYRCAQKNNLVVHERTHTGYKPFACPYCDYRTVQKPNLVKHMYLHTDQKPFSCDQCSYRCVQKTNLTKHKQRHLNEKAGEKVDLKSQTKPYRPRQKSVKCPHCPYKCVQKSSLDKHIEFKHGAVSEVQPSENELIQNLSVKKDECQEEMQVS